MEWGDSTHIPSIDAVVNTEKETTPASPAIVITHPQY